ncbi:1389_t:CDS:2 [Entrophospora sp. SA101]|nr:10653_t:CDS:2 [Entrophospora sp. SA101]CAJ0765370.1 17187_t:CDS:2 [Entrophospora sp. SA101]CAJ0769284.1 1389_t:CDS:2 [Entrophospora sp. SA101]
MSNAIIILRPTIADVVTDSQLLKAVEILREKTSLSAYSLASMLIVINYVLGKPYFSDSVFGNKTTVDFEYNGGTDIIDKSSSPGITDANTTSSSSTPMDVDPPRHLISNSGGGGTVQHLNLILHSPQLLQPTIADILSDEETLSLIELLKQKTRESPIKFASLLCIVKAVLEDVGLKGNLFQNKIKFQYQINGIQKDFLIEFEENKHYYYSHYPDDYSLLKSNQILSPNDFSPLRISSPTVFNRHHHGASQDMSDELEKDEIVDGSLLDQEAWNTHGSPIANAKRKRDCTNSDEDHSTQPNNKTKRRSTDKHKAPPLSCEAVKRLFTGITKAVLLQRLDEAKALIASIKEGYSNVRSPPSNSNDNMFSNLELYKLFTTYNNYKEELAQNSHANPHHSPNNNHHSDSSLSPLEKTGGKEVGKHRLNCAWRLSILCELLGKGVLLMTKELSGAKLERILVEEFSKLVDFLRNPDNHDWVASVREKMDLAGFDDVYKPLDDADLESNLTAAATSTTIIAPQTKSNTLSSPSSSSTATITSTNLTTGDNNEIIHRHGLDIDSNTFNSDDHSDIPNILTFTIDPNSSILQQQEQQGEEGTTATADVATAI